MPFSWHSAPQIQVLKLSLRTRSSAADRSITTRAAPRTHRQHRVSSLPSAGAARPRQRSGPSQICPPSFQTGGNCFFFLLLEGARLCSLISKLALQGSVLLLGQPEPQLNSWVRENQQRADHQPRMGFLPPPEPSPVPLGVLLRTQGPRSAQLSTSQELSSCSEPFPLVTEPQEVWSSAPARTGERRVPRASHQPHCSRLHGGVCASCTCI